MKMKKKSLRFVAGVLAVTDEGLAKAVLKRITAEHEEE